MPASHRRTDLACEQAVHIANGKQHLYPHGIRVEEAEDSVGKIRYYTVHCGPIWAMEPSAAQTTAYVAASLLRTLLRDLLGHPPGAQDSILVAGVGNRSITADALGPMTADRITVTGHSPRASLPMLLHCCRVSAFAPGVSAQTGLDGTALIRKAAETAHASLILAVDALAARSAARLGTILQISDGGIRPGSGIGSTTAALQRDTMGIPVVGIGIPTLIDAATLATDLWEQVQSSPSADDFSKIPENGREFFVSPRETDLIAEAGAQLLSHIINMVLTPALQT